MNEQDSDQIEELSVCSHVSDASFKQHSEYFVLICSEEHNVEKQDAAGCTSVVTSLMKGKMALMLVAEEANCQHSAKNSCLQGWALRCNLLQMNTRSLQEAADNKDNKFIYTVLLSNNCPNYEIDEQKALKKQTKQINNVHPANSSPYNNICHTHN